MGLPNGIHHLAICTKDIKKQIEFFTDVCGMELVALYWMHGVKNTFHGFLKMGDSSSIAFVQGPEVGEIQIIAGDGGTYLYPDVAQGHDVWIGPSSSSRRHLYVRSHNGRTVVT